jgi:hypothetical protein
VALTLRLATEADLGAIVGLTATHRHRLAEWSPAWWSVAEGADEIHSLWLQYLIGADDPIVRVIDDGQTVVGCAVSMPQAGQWFIDDMAIDDDAAWTDLGRDLFEAIPERPALTCVATADRPRADGARAAGLELVSSYWIRPTEGGAFSSPAIPAGIALPEAPAHTFGATFDAFASGALAFSDDDGGVLVGSPSIAAPPVYGSGGTVCVVDRIVGADRAGLLDVAVAGAGARGDVLLNVVAGATDAELIQLLTDRGFVRTVDVHRWP